MTHAPTPDDAARVATDEEIAEWRKFGEASLDVYGERPPRESYLLLRGFIDSLLNRLSREQRDLTAEKDRAERTEARNSMLEKAIGDIGYGLRSMDKTSRVVQLLVGIIDAISTDIPEAPNDR